MVESRERLLDNAKVFKRNMQPHFYINWGEKCVFMVSHTIDTVIYGYSELYLWQNCSVWFNVIFLFILYSLSLLYLFIPLVNIIQTHRFPNTCIHLSIIHCFVSRLCLKNWIKPPLLFINFFTYFFLSNEIFRIFSGDLCPLQAFTKVLNAIFFNSSG